MSTFTHTHSATFTVTHAKHLASKIAADLNACSRLHGQPSVSAVEIYNEELVELLRYGYLSRYEFGFKRDDKRVLSWSYEVDASGNISTDERAGRCPLTSIWVEQLSSTTLWYSNQVRRPHFGTTVNVQGLTSGQSEPLAIHPATVLDTGAALRRTTRRAALAFLGDHLGVTNAGQCNGWYFR